MSKNAYFWNKNAKITSALGLHPQAPIYLWRLRAPPSDPHVITPAYNYKSIEFNSVVFVDGGARIFLAPSVGYLSYATA